MSVSYLKVVMFISANMKMFYVKIALMKAREIIEVRFMDSKPFGDYYIQLDRVLITQGRQKTGLRSLFFVDFITRCLTQAINALVFFPSV